MSSTKFLEAQKIEDARNAQYGEDRWRLGGGIDGKDPSKVGGLVDQRYALDGGKTRDADGTIDRVRDPPKELLPFLYAVKMQCSSYNISIDQVFEAAGGTAYGVIPATKFQSALVVTFQRLHIKQELLAAIAEAYGTGYQAPEGSKRSIGARFEAVAWKDFCEDVNKAVDVSGRELNIVGGPPALDLLVPDGKDPYAQHPM